ncbi:S8 family serine peptidase [Roseibium sp. MMSF_3412]|uniref:S8 family serine peptidase n=1 Tax=Roseibium sp. MMSF_3412 TaxID=3046712 RepID=UPI0027400BCE|nr:S8 family serine peptidase [Roseibium sp. MMSF_3412]
MERRLQHQFDRIMDETAGNYTDVIVQFTSDRRRTLVELLSAAVETEQNRSMVVDAKTMFPPKRSAFSGETSARRVLRNKNASLAANIALSAVGSLAATYLAPDSISQVTNFLSSTTVDEAVQKVRKYKSQKDRAAPLAMPNIDAARIMVHRGELKKVLEEAGDKLEGVYQNAHIPTPRTTKSDGSLEILGGGYEMTTWGLERTKALGAWSVFGTRGQRKDGSKVRVAVLDTGIDATHPDLFGKVSDFAEFDPSGNITAQGVANARDSGSHGTHVAGTIVGGNASGSWIGMAPDAEVIAGLVLNGDAGGTLAQVIAGIDWAVNNKAEIVNMSLGGLTFDSTVDTPYQRAIVDALLRGTLVIAAIGNDGHQTSGAPGNDYFSLAVGAHDIRDRCAGFSGGRTHILRQSNVIDSDFLPLVYTKPDLSAPGVSIKSCVPNGGYESFNGTSMATPHVAGAAALLYAATDLKSLAQDRRAFTAKDLLLGGVMDVGESGQDQRFGHGAINILRSIDEAIKLGF